MDQLPEIKRKIKILWRPTDWKNKGSLMVSKVRSAGVECPSRDVKRKKIVWLRVAEWGIGLLKNKVS